MKIFQSTLATIVETAIKTRTHLDSHSLDALRRLDRKRILINVRQETFMLSFVDGRPSVASDTSDAPDLSITGPMRDVTQLLFGAEVDGVEIEGEADLLTDLQTIFRPKVDPYEIAERVKSGVGAGVTAARSAIQGLASEFSKSRADSAPEASPAQTDLEQEIDNLKKRVAALEQRAEGSESA